MSNIDKQAVQAVADLKAGYTLGHADVAILNELARIALASLEAEPVAYIRDGFREDGVHFCGGIITAEEHERTKPALSDRYNWKHQPLYTAPPAPVVPAELHPDTQKLVTDFCTALAEKLYKAQLKYGYDADWKQDGWPTQCQAHFHQHIAKGDPRDVAAYCAFMWYHGWKTEAVQPEPVSVPTFDEWLEIRGNKPLGWVKDAMRESYDACRAAMLQGADNELQRKSEIHDALCAKYNVESLADFVDWQRNHIAELEAAPPAPVGEGETAVMPDYPGYVMTQRECFQAGKKAGMAEAGNSPVIPDGWVLVPIEPTYQMCEAMGLPWESPRFPDRYKAMIEAINI